MSGVGGTINFQLYSINSISPIGNSRTAFWGLGVSRLQLPLIDLHVAKARLQSSIVGKFNSFESLRFGLCTFVLLFYALKK